jgi:PAS domain S-box-containing protein
MDSEKKIPQIPRTKMDPDSGSINRSYINALQVREIQEIRKREERYQMMIAEIQDYAIFMLDKDGFIQNWNQGAEKIKGYKAEEIIGKNFRIFYPRNDQDRKLPESLIKEATENNRASHEGWRVRKDGTYFWGSVVITALHDDSRNIIGFSKVTRDLTERKLAEERLLAYAGELKTKNEELQSAYEDLTHARIQLADDRTRYIIEALPHIVATTTSDGTLNYSNQNLFNFTGLNSLKLKKDEWYEIIFEEDRENFISAWRRSLFTGLPLQIECRLRRADGEHFWHLAIAKLLYHLEANMTFWILTFTNIHEQKMLTEEKDEFIGIASHELKTPLTSAKAYIQLLHSVLENKDGQEALLYAQKANSSIDRLNSLISELLDISKIQHNKLQLNLSDFNFEDLLKESIELMQATSTRHAIYLKGSSNVMVRGDRERLHQVLINLLSNAIKYSPASIRIDVKVRVQDNEIIVEVTDYGIGIPAADFQKIFDKFYRVEEKATQFQGLGIGLFICAEIVHRHNGEIWVESTLGSGSSFFFKLPI